MIKKSPYFGSDKVYHLSGYVDSDQAKQLVRIIQDINDDYKFVGKNVLHLTINKLRDGGYDVSIIDIEGTKPGYFSRTSMPMIKAMELIEDLNIELIKG